MSVMLDPQVQASNPRASVFVAANAGSGKTVTLVKRVARLLLNGARPEAILCVTYTKAGAAEMERRLFRELGSWAVMANEALSVALAEIDEPDRELHHARALFARALETPGGLKIETIHAFCEKVLRRFPLEAGISPGFWVLEDAAATEVSAEARDKVAVRVLAERDSPVAEAYDHLCIELDWASWNDMFQTFEARRASIAAYVKRCDGAGGYRSDVWRRCGFDEPTTLAAAESRAASRVRWGPWGRAAEALASSAKTTDRALAEAMMAVQPGARFSEVWAVFSTRAGTPKKKLCTNSIDAGICRWLLDEQARHLESQLNLAAATVAENTVRALTLATAYAGAYEDAKQARGALDFADLIACTHRLLTERADAAWVLYKLDGGLEHVLLDEAQDTAPQQWDILRALTDEFFSGAGAGPAGRTVFAVGDPKQSIFSFQGADPKKLALETQNAEAAVLAAGQRFDRVDLRKSWRSTPEILSFVDAVIAIPEVLPGLNPTDGSRVIPFPGISHTAARDPAGCVELWPLVGGEDVEEVDPWAPVDAEPPKSANKLLATRIAVSIKAMVEDRHAVLDRETMQMRPCRFGDVLILVRRRRVLFHEIIRALKRLGVPVTGADRLKLSDHGVFEDLMALGRFARFQSDDLTLAGLLRGPFCNVGEESLFDLAYGRDTSLWGVLNRRQDERPEWHAALEFLAWARRESERASPFDFYCRVLGRLDQPDVKGRSMRQRILTRLGAEGEEALDAFVAQALAAEGRGIRDLETFLHGMAAIELEIKREPDGAHDHGAGEVRVMTVHGAKGLEAPIVILPDTSIRATAHRGPLLETADGGFLWAPRPTEDCEASAAAREVRLAATDHESARLLYVALTRARDRLVVCGVESGKAWFERSWYHLVQRAFDDLPIHAFPLEGGGEGWRYGLDPTRAERTDEVSADAPLPDWTRGFAPSESGGASRASPSSLKKKFRSAAPSPLSAVAGLGRYRRGELIHRLLQLLPDLPPGERAAVAGSILAKERDLTADQRGEMANAALAVLNDQQFADIFGPGCRAEVTLAGVAAGLPLSGRVDRLLLEDHRVVVIDFKTNLPAPQRIEDVDPDDVRQMAIYVAILAQVYPGRKIEAALVWTDGPKLMPVPQSAMRKALDALAENA